MDAKISPSFWSDPDIETLEPGIKLTYLWMLTNAQRNVCGFLQVSGRRFTFETGLDEPMLLKTCEALPRALKPFPDINTIYIRKFIHYQLGRGEQLTKNNIFKAIVSCWQSITHKPLKDLISQDYPEIMKGLEGLTKGLQAQREEKRREGEEKEGGAGGSVEAHLYTLEDIKSAAATIGLPDCECQNLFDHYNSQGWKKGNGLNVTNLHSIVSKWKAKWEADGRPMPPEPLKPQVPHEYKDPFFKKLSESVK